MRAGPISPRETPRGNVRALQPCRIKTGSLSESGREQARDASAKMLLPLSLASAVRWRSLSKVKKDLTKDKKWDKLYLVVLSGLLYKWMSKPACYWSSQWTSHSKGNEQLDVILSQNVLSRIFFFFFEQLVYPKAGAWKEGLKSENITQYS